MPTVSKATFNNKNSFFFDALKKKIDHYFSENKIKQSGNLKLYYKAIILVTTLVALYVVLVFFTPQNDYISLALCFLLGINFAAIGFNLMHDGGHGSFSSKPWVNKMMAHSLELMGGSSFMWNLKHNQNHHTFTNIEGMDDDIDIKPFIRVSQDQPKKWYHRFQHIYSSFLYALTYILWVFWLDYRKYFSGKIGEIKIKKMSLKDQIIFWGSKVIYLILFLVIPILKVGLWDTLIGYTLAAMVTGFVISVVFQLAHIVEGAYFPEITEDTPLLKIETEWAIHQLRSTANFATKNKFVSWFIGGLNYQVEHHLFPKVCHIHYPKINKIVQETCKEHNITYLEFPTVFSAYKSHLTHLKQVGRAA